MNILITGGTSGLGKATVERLVKNKANKVFFTYLETNEYRDVAQEFIERYNNVEGYPLDFCNADSFEHFCGIINEIDPDVLINSTYVGNPQTTYFHKIPIGDFVKGFNNNLVPTIRITQTAIDCFKKKKFGKIINVITEAVMGLPPMGYSIYAANKAYLMELSNVWNKEYTRYNITSNCILPAYMQTKFATVDERIEEQMTKQHPLKKLLSVTDVAEIIAFLVEAPQQLNGVKIPINAGQIIY